MTLQRRDLLVRRGLRARLGLLVGGVLRDNGAVPTPPDPPDPEDLPDITAPGPLDTPDVADPLVATTAEFTFPDQTAVTRTTWTLKDVLTGEVVFESRRDPVNLFEITIPADTMTFSTAYTLYVHFFGHGRLVTRRASVTFTTALAAWVEDLRAPSGALPIHAANFLLDEYYISGAAGLLADFINRPQDVQPGVGLVADSIITGEAPLLVGAPLATVLTNSFTIVQDFKMPAATGPYATVFRSYDAVGQTEDISLLASTLTAFTQFNEDNDTDSRQVLSNVAPFRATADVFHLCAATRTAAHIAYSVGGGAAIVDAGAVDHAPACDAAGFFADTSGGVASACTTRIWAIYAPQPDGDLDNMSA